MVYTITIEDRTEQAQSLIRFLQTLALDYPFLKIETESESILSIEQEKELDRRLDYVLKNPTVGKSWKEIERKLL